MANHSFRIYDFVCPFNRTLSVSQGGGLQFVDLTDNQVTEEWSWDQLKFVYFKNNGKIKFEKKTGLVRKIKLQDASADEEARFVEALRRSVQAERSNLAFPRVKIAFRIRA